MSHIASDSVESADELNRLLPEYEFGHVYSTVIRSGDLQRVFDLTYDVPLGKSSLISNLFRIRGLPSADLGGRAFAQSMEWCDLWLDPPYGFVIGYVTGGGARRIEDASQFMKARCRQKVAFSFRFVQVSPECVKVTTETRVAFSSAKDASRYRWYWWGIRYFSGLIRTEILRLVREAAEAEWVEQHAGRFMPVPKVIAKLPLAVLIPLRAAVRLGSAVAPRKTAAALVEILARLPRRPMPQPHQAFLKTADPLHFSFGGTSVAGYGFGSGPVVLLLHGLMGSAANFRHLIPALVASGLRVLAIDLPNHGNSPNGPIFAEHSVRALSAVMEGIDALHAVVAHSAGAYFAVLAIDRMAHGRRPRRCVFLAAPTTFGVPITAYMHHLTVPRTLYGDSCRWFAARLDVPLEEQNFATLLERSGGSLGCEELLFVHDPQDPHAPYAPVEHLAVTNVGVSLLPAPDLGHFRVLQDGRIIGAISRFIHEGAVTDGRGGAR